MTGWTNTTPLENSMTANLIQAIEYRDGVRASYASRAKLFLENDLIPLETGNDTTCCSPRATGEACCRENSGGACCNTTTGACCTNGATSLGYSRDDLSQIPPAVAEMTLGCGNPLSILALNPGQRVLDLGSGGGLDCLLAAQRVGESGWVIGVDMTPEMLSLAWRNAARVGARNIEFRLGYIESLPVESDTIDVVLSNCVINLSPDKPAVFREAFRVLRSGGTFAVSDIVSDGPIPRHRADDESLRCACVAGAIEEAAYLDELRKVGFTHVRVIARTPYADVPASTIKTFSVSVQALK